MPHRERHKPNIAGLEIEGPCLTGSAEHTHAPLALDPVLPFVGVRMPMELAQSSWLDLDKGCGDRLGSGEHAGIGDPHRPATGLDWVLRHHPMAEAVWHWSRPSNRVGCQWARD